jgi:hypothetical protein
MTANHHQQDFEVWNKQKQQIHFSDHYTFFREGEIRWAYFGKNIGTESAGKGQAFARPVLILKKVFGNSAIVFNLARKKWQLFFCLYGYEGQTALRFDCTSTLFRREKNPQKDFRHSAARIYSFGRKFFCSLKK